MAYPRASRLGGQLETIPSEICHLYIPNSPTADSPENFVRSGKIENQPAGMWILFQALPVVTDGKGAKYDPTPVIGRATPLLTYANSDMRTISADLSFFVTQTNSGGIGSVKYNLAALRAIASAVYPRSGIKGVTYRPPPVCQFKYGDFISRLSSMCVIIDKYSVKNDPSVPSDPETLCPYKFIVNVNMIKVYSSEDLPNQDSIWEEGV